MAYLMTDFLQILLQLLVIKLLVQLKLRQWKQRIIQLMLRKIRKWLKEILLIRLLWIQPRTTPPVAVRRSLPPLILG